MLYFSKFFFSLADYPAKAMKNNLYYLICNDKKVFII